jgi:hypothetical protein
MDTTIIQQKISNDGVTLKNDRARTHARGSDETNKPKARRHLWTDKDIKDAMSNTLSQKQQNHINKNKK